MPHLKPVGHLKLGAASSIEFGPGLVVAVFVVFFHLLENGEQ